jgi:hypothetical protein
MLKLTWVYHVREYQSVDLQREQLRVEPSKLEP